MNDDENVTAEITNGVSVATSFDSRQLQYIQCLLTTHDFAGSQ